MIRRISNKNDYIDIVRSCPSGVIDDIYEVEYYVDGYSNVYSASFSKKGSLLEVIIPSSALQTLPSGLLMRRAKYRNEDTSFPDGNYDLEFVEDMNVWLEGDGTSPGPGPASEYVTEEELEETLEGYVTDQEFSGAVYDLRAHIDAVEGSLSDYVTDQVFDGFVTQTESRFNDVNAHLQNTDARVAALEQSPGGVSQEQFANHVAANDVSFEILRLVTDDHSQRISALENAGFATSQDLDAVGQHIDDVDNKADAIQDQVDSIDTIVSNLSDSVSDLDTRVTDLEQGGGGGGGTWGSITGDIQDQSDLMDEFNQDRGRLDDLENGTVVPTGIATESWVQNQGYASDTDLDSLESRVSVLEHGGSPVTLSWGGISGTITDQTDLVNYVDQAIEDAISGSDIPLPENVVEYDVDHPLIEDFGLNVDVLKRNEFDHGTDVITKGLVLGYEEIKDNGDITDINTIEIRNGLLQSVSYSFDGVDYHESRDPYATESYVQNQGYITSTALSGYATQTWVGQQGYITSSALSGYATESWATNQFLEESKVWTGTETQWNQLSAAQKASYTIALITQ